MPLSLDQSNSPFRIGLEGEINIRCASELKDLLLQALALEGSLHVDLSATTEVDITTLQLLWAAQREASATGKEFLLTGPISDIIAAVMDRSGLHLTVGVA
jgi:anti-anti-sigma regulatory factor